ncbi:hypothetical protein [Paucibacter soli]|uniref:hypothetical protein n=1 Tax=Paucibacter soli TaxID=3133433 RepID=UPI0030A913FF
MADASALNILVVFIIGLAVAVLFGRISFPPSPRSPDPVGRDDAGDHAHCPAACVRVALSNETELRLASEVAVRGGTLSGECDRALRFYLAACTAMREGKRVGVVNSNSGLIESDLTDMLEGAASGT